MIKHNEITDLKDMLAQTVSRYGDEAAFRLKAKDGGIFDVTYGQFKRDIDALGSALVELGLKGSFVAVMGENRYDWCLSYLTIVCGLGVVVPMDKELPPDDIKNLINISKSTAIIYSSKYEKNLNSIRSELTSVEYFICMDAESYDLQTLSLKKLIERGRLLLDEGYAEYTSLSVDPEKMSILLFTSGTTGHSKGVMLSHTNICSNITSVVQTIDVGHDDLSLSMLPLHHTYECTLGFLLLMYLGAKIAFAEGVKYISQNLSEFKPTVMISVPLILESMYKKVWTQASKEGSLKKLKFALKISPYLPAQTRRKLFHKVHAGFGGKLRLMVVGAAAIDPNVSKGFYRMGFKVLQGYGLTECSPLVTGNRENAFRHDSIGLPIPGVEVRLSGLDENNIGEIAVRGKNVMLGYFDDPEATADVIRDGWLYTGDLACVDKKGFYRITGRKKNVIVTKNGKNIYPEEIESYLLKSPFVQECIVWAKLDEASGESYVNASIYPNMEAIREKFKMPNISADDLKKIFRDLIKSVNTSIPFYKNIKNFTIKETEFIKTTTQKIKRYVETKTAGNKEDKV